MSSKLVVEFKEVVGGRTSSPVQSKRFFCDYDHSDHNSHSNGLGISFEEVKELLEQNRNLKKSVATLRNASAGTSISDSKIQAAIASAESAICSIDPHVTALWDQIPAQQKPITTDNNKAQEVFDVAELLEMILVKLPPKTILSSQGVSRGWKDAIKASINLQQAICLKPAIKYYSPFDVGYPYTKTTVWPGIKYHLVSNCWLPYMTDSPSEPRPVDNDQYIEIGIDFQKELTVGETCKAMYLCQPPPKEAVIYGGTYGYDSDGSALTTNSIIKDDDGLTVGHMLDGVAELKAFTEGEIDKAYMVETEPPATYQLKAIVKLSDADSIMKMRHRLAEQEAKRHKEKADRKAAKKAAADNGGDPYDTDYDSDVSSVW